MNIWYLAGPMTGIPQFNFPAFLAAAEALRDQGFNVISPAELDQIADITDKAFTSTDGDLKNAGILDSWGDFLARDVKLIADVCSGIIFLDGWEKSRGARLEAFVGLLAGHHFATYLRGGNIQGMSANMVLTKIARQTSEDIRNA